MPGTQDRLIALDHDGSRYCTRETRGVLEKDGSQEPSLFQKTLAACAGWARCSCPLVSPPGPRSLWPSRETTLAAQALFPISFTRAQPLQAVFNPSCLSTRWMSESWATPTSVNSVFTYTPWGRPAASMIVYLNWALDLSWTFRDNIVAKRGSNDASSLY